MAQAAEVIAVEEWRRHWPVVLASMFGVTLCASHGYTIGVMIHPLEQAFHWTRSAITGGLLIISVLAVVVSPLTGRLADRIGPRRVALVGVPVFCLGLGLLSTATADVRIWWALWLIVGAGNMLILPTIWTAAINSRFDRNRGLALAVALCGTGLAAFLLPPITARLIIHYGWRAAYVGIAASSFLVIFPLTWFCFRSARDLPAAARAHPEIAAQPMGGNLREDMLSARFLKLLGASTFFSVTICALTTNAVPVLRGIGHSDLAAADIAGLMGIGSVTGRLCGGFLLDRMEARKVAAISVLAPVITALLLLYAGESRPVAMIAMLTLGLAIGTEVDACAYLAARHFGLRNFGTLFGTINGLMLLGNGFAPFAANWVYDVTRSYDPVLWAQVPACLLSSVCFLMLGQYRDVAPTNTVESAPAT